MGGWGEEKPPDPEGARQSEPRDSGERKSAEPGAIPPSRETTAQWKMGVRGRDKQQEETEPGRWGDTVQKTLPGPSRSGHWGPGSVKSEMGADPEPAPPNGQWGTPRGYPNAEWRNAEWPNQASADPHAEGDLYHLPGRRARLEPRLRSSGTSSGLQPRGKIRDTSPVHRRRIRQRLPIEALITLGKRKFGWGKCRARNPDHELVWIGLGAAALNAHRAFLAEPP